MPRTARQTPGDIVFHVLNRGVGRRRLFDKPADYDAFERAVEDTLAQRPMRICAYFVMPNHWHLVLWPRRDGDLAAFMQKLTITHVRRWQEHRHQVGYGHLYQGRYKSFPVQDDRHYLTVCRYVERNPLRARLVRQAENWRWSSLHRLQAGAPHDRWLHAGPLDRPRDWLARVNEPQRESEVEALRQSIARGRPFGEAGWVERMAARLGLESAFRPRGRPRKEEVKV